MEIRDTREEILKRSKIMIEQRRRRVKRSLEGVSVALVAMLVFVMRQIPSSLEIDMDGTYYGTLLQGRDVGMYIIVGLICFVLGVIITLITVKFRDNNEERSKDIE